MPAPTNITALMAVDIGTTLPYSTSQTGIHDAGTTYEVWYSYVAQPDDVVIGVFGFGDLVTYLPRSWVYTGTAAAPTVYLSMDPAGINVPIYLPVTPGETYFFRFVPNAGNPNPATLTLSIVLHDEQTAPVGSIAVNDDAAGFPLALLTSSGSDVEVLRYVQDIAAGEQVGVLANGTIALSDSVTEVIKIYSADYTELATVPATGGLLTSNKVETFYTYTFDTDVLAKFTASGVIDQSWSITPGTVSAIGVSPDEEVLYYFNQAVSTIIKRWDLVNDVALADLVTVAGRLVKDMVVLDSGALVVADSTNDVLLQLNGTTGATLQSDALVSSLDDRLTRGLTEATVWVWNKQNVGDDEEDFKEIRLSDGATLQTIHGYLFSAGVYRGTATATPGARFSNSNSCPLWITRTAGNGSILVIKETVGGDPTEFAFEAGGGLSPSEFTLSDGESQAFDDLEPGDGYSLTETLPPLWSSTAVVSNGTLNAIVVEAGETTTITVTNTPQANGPEALEVFEATGFLRDFDVPRVRTAPHLADENQRLFYSRFELDLESGVGTVTGQGVDPVVLMRYSNDGGFTWSSWQQLSVGRLGQYKFRCDAWRLGMARDRVFQIRQTDPVKTAWLAAYLDFEAGDS